MVEPTDSEYDGPTLSICLYQIENGRQNAEPRKLRSLLLPPFEGEYTLDITCTPSTPVYAGNKACVQSNSGSSIYNDHDWLCHITVTGSRLTREYVLYPSVFLLPQFYGAMDVPWASWGLQYAFIFEYKCNGPRMVVMRAQGDRVAVCCTGDPSEDALKEWSFYLMDFRPARVKRARQNMSSQPAWPEEPFKSQSMSSDAVFSHSGLGYIKTRELKTLACASMAVVDCERVVINKVHPSTFLPPPVMVNNAVLRSCAPRISKLFLMSSHSDED